jgi:hypothetical protein
MKITHSIPDYQGHNHPSYLVSSFVSGIESAMRSEDGGSPFEHLYEVGDSFKGFAGDFSEEEVERFQKEEDIDRLGSWWRALSNGILEVGVWHE